MGKVIVVTSGKGGVGKTTTTANLGAGLAQLGRSVALVDADIGLRNLDVVMGLENRIVYDLVDLVEGRCDLKQALIRDKRFRDLYLIAASQVRDKNAVSPKQMQALTAQLASMFDYVLVDCPAGIEQGFKNAVAGADEAIVVVTPELSSVRDADRIIGLLTAGGMAEERIRLIINRIRPKMVSRGNMLSPQEVADILSLQILGTVVDDESIIVSTNRGDAAVLRKRSLAGRAYKNICDRIEGLAVPLMRHEKRSVLERFFGLNVTAVAPKRQREERSI
ncbi:MAG: septum site-determining protein MinD [Clostridia bacterium]|nr:septum site-determining protein MinD [Clostridia bacterium]